MSDLSRALGASVVLGSACIVLAIIAAKLPTDDLLSLRKMRSGETSSPQSAGQPAGTVSSSPANATQYNYPALRRAITYGRASLGETRRAMTDSDPASLSNSLHALFAMRWHRGVVHLLDGMWDGDKEKYPELAWAQLSKAPARIALASTINRVKIVDTAEYQQYIRQHGQDAHEFNRAQVAVALGFNGDSRDLPLLRALADGDNHYVAQSAITGLSVFGGNAAR
ncbi:MAG: hypothetical protein ACU84Q_19595, partial [Gammaproteobacteria bacterium]